MAELNPRERLRPFLLDTLTDENPSQRDEGRDRRPWALAQMREALLRDLSHVLNSKGRLSPEDAKEFPMAAASVINFGMKDITGIEASGINATELERNFLQAIQLFEPRIRKSSLVVRVLSDAKERRGKPAAEHNVLSVEIRGDAVVQPYEQKLYLKTEVDLETGQYRLREQPNG